MFYSGKDQGIQMSATNYEESGYGHDLDLPIISHKSCVSCPMRNGCISRSVHSNLAYLGIKISWNSIHQCHKSMQPKQWHHHEQINNTNSNLDTQTLTKLGPTSLTMPLTRLQWLLELFTQIKTHHMIKFLQPPPQDFTMELSLHEA